MMLEYISQTCSEHERSVLERQQRAYLAPCFVLYTGEECEQAILFL